MRKLKRYRGTYTDFGARYLGRMREIEPHWISHSLGLCFGIFLTWISLPFLFEKGGEFFIFLGLAAIYGNVLGLMVDWKKRNWSISDY